jgi:RNA polymerase sigma-70 factor (ECF subfamily)
MEPSTGTPVPQKGVMEVRSDQDQRLTRRVLEGDSEAFGGLVSSYQRMVASVAWRYGIHQQEIEDVVSEVFIKAYRNLHRYRPEHPFSTWLYRLASNHAIDHVRRARKERGRSEMPEQLTDPTPVASEGMEVDERAVLVRESMTELKERYREVLFLVYVEGHSIEETARLLGLPTGTVKTRLMRGRNALGKLLSRRHPEHFGALGDNA